MAGRCGWGQRLRRTRARIPRWGWSWGAAEFDDLNGPPVPMSDSPKPTPQGDPPAVQPDRTAPSLRGLAIARAALLALSLSLAAGWWMADPWVAVAVGVATAAGSLNGWVLRGQHQLPSAQQLLQARAGSQGTATSGMLSNESSAGLPSSGSNTNALLAELAPELNGLSRNVSTLMTRLGDTSMSGEQLELLEAAQGAQGQLGTLLGDVFDLVRIEAGRLKLRRRDFELREEVEEVLEQLCPLAWKRGLDLTAEIDESVPERLFADPRRLRQVIQHLLRATLRSTDSGEVFLKATGRMEKSARVLRLEIRDTAPRRSIAEFERLRERRPSALENLNELDLSLGLALAESFSDVMGGRFGVGIEGHAGNGLWIEVPVEVPEAATEEAAREDQELVGRRMLVIEARAAARETLVTAGNRLGLRVDEAADEHEAARILRAAAAEQDPIQLILLDDGLGGGIGREVVQRLTRGKPWPRPLSLLLTAGGGHENPAELVRMGVDAWVPKPLRLKRLEEGIRHVLAQSAASPGASDGGAVPHLVSGLATGTLEAPKGEFEEPAPVRVLLLEPDPALARVQVALLRKLGCRVAWQDEPAGFLRQYQDAVFDLLLADRAALLEIEESSLDSLVDARDGAQDVLISWEHDTPQGSEQGRSASDPAFQESEKAPSSQAPYSRVRCADLELEKPTNPLAVHTLLSTLLGNAASPPTENPSLLESLPQPLPVNDDSAPIDLDVIQSLKDLGGEDEPGLFRELVDMFLRDTPPRMEALGQALEAGDAGSLERVAHSMKSSCGNLGAVVMADLCAQLEKAGREGSLESASDLLQRSTAEFQRVIEALEAELA